MFSSLPLILEKLNFILTKLYIYHPMQAHSDLSVIYTIVELRIWDIVKGDVLKFHPVLHTYLKFLEKLLHDTFSSLACVSKGRSNKNELL